MQMYYNLFLVKKNVYVVTLYFKRCTNCSYGNMKKWQTNVSKYNNLK